MRVLADLESREILPLIEDACRNIASHTGLWFRYAEEKLGLQEAISLDERAWQAWFPSQSTRLLQTSALKEGRPVSGLLAGDWSKGHLMALLEDLAKSWLAADGLWFQAVENSHGMALAKQINDRAWETFTVIEAKRIMERLRIPPDSGLAGLEQALVFRLYARINEQETLHPAQNKLLFRMNNCRVQAARERKNLAPYPCKSGGIVEYTYFARAIDPRIETRCLTCPPDPHPPEYHCAWEFEME